MSIMSSVSSTLRVYGFDEILSEGLMVNLSVPSVPPGQASNAECRVCGNMSVCSGIYQ